jgi:ornithine cyclodeaminase
MLEDNLLILKGHEVLSLLTGRERQIVDTVGAVYVDHHEGAGSLPQSTFLRFPDDKKKRMIALPAYLGQDFQFAGIKWIASFPGNKALGLDRASAVIILNSARTGRPRAIIEGSVISAKRTAASAALAAQRLHLGNVSSVGIIGCGLINFETVRFLLALFPGIKSLALFDKHEAQALQFGDKCRELLREIKIEVATEINAVLATSSLISIATTAITPHISDLSSCAEGTVILHISLRDLSAEAILSADNVVDDVDHVCRAQTSVHLAEQLIGHRTFIRCCLADVLTGRAAAKSDQNDVTVFSPFGLGVLDLGVSKLVYDLAIRERKGLMIGSFLPEPWLSRREVDLSLAS